MWKKRTVNVNDDAVNVTADPRVLFSNRVDGEESRVLIGPNGDGESFTTFGVI